MGKWIPLEKPGIIFDDCICDGMPHSLSPTSVACPLIIGPISAQRSVGSLSVAMGFLCDDGVFVWRSSRDSNPVTIGPVLIFSVLIATPLC